MEITIKIVYKLLGLLLVLALINVVTNVKLQNTVEGKNLVEITKKRFSYVTSKNVDKTLECLAMNIYKEAGNESFEGKVAVAQVTLNRVDHSDFPNEVCSVVYQKNIIMQKVVCQFSWYCDSVQRSRPINKEIYNESYAVAKKVLLEGFRLDSLHDALYYHADYVNPRWSHVKIGKIGTHIFYRNKV